ncbi:hypothetical protein [Bacillus thuringiensis]
MGRWVGISERMILNWVNEYKENGVEGFVKGCRN